MSPLDEAVKAIKEWLSMAGYLKGALSWTEWCALMSDEKEAVRERCRELGWEPGR